MVRILLSDTVARCFSRTLKLKSYGFILRASSLTIVFFSGVVLKDAVTLIFLSRLHSVHGNTVTQEMSFRLTVLTSHDISFHSSYYSLFLKEELTAKLLEETI